MFIDARFSVRFHSGGVTCLFAVHEFPISRPDSTVTLLRDSTNPHVTPNGVKTLSNNSYL
jgi:hypothetical protein